MVGIHSHGNDNTQCIIWKKIKIWYIFLDYWTLYSVQHGKWCGMYRNSKRLKFWYQYNGDRDLDAGCARSSNFFKEELARRYRVLYRTIMKCNSISYGILLSVTSWAIMMMKKDDTTSQYNSSLLAVCRFSLF